MVARRAESPLPPSANNVHRGTGTRNMFCCWVSPACLLYECTFRATHLKIIKEKVSPFPWPQLVFMGVLNTIEKTDPF